MTLFPHTTLFRSAAAVVPGIASLRDRRRSARRDATRRTAYGRGLNSLAAAPRINCRAYRKSITLVYAGVPGRLGEVKKIIKGTTEGREVKGEVKLRDTGEGGGRRRRGENRGGERRGKHSRIMPAMRNAWFTAHNYERATRVPRG